jgi:hypothetical protein
MQKRVSSAVTKGRQEVNSFRKGVEGCPSASMKESLNRFRIRERWISPNKFVKSTGGSCEDH